MLARGTALDIETDGCSFECATFLRVVDGEAECVDDLYDCVFLVDHEGTRFRIYGWNASDIVAA